MGRSPCCEKKNGLKKGPWTTEEDQKLNEYIKIHGYGNWRTLPKNAGLQRCGKSCRLRWINYLRPDIKRGRFSFEEEETIIQLHSLMGNKWSTIAARLPGRTDNEIKNYWNTHITKKLLKFGIDPITHNPRLDLPHHHHQHMNMSSLKMIDHHHHQPLVNPELLKFFSTSQKNQTEDNQNQTGYNLICNQELQFMEFQDDLMSMPLLLPTNQDESLCSEFASVLTTTSSSSIPLQSSSTSPTYINSSSCNTEDEKESYCSNYNNFMSNSELFDYTFDVNRFLQFQEPKNDWDIVI